ncbi:MAG: RNA polymerase subunit sigma-70 [Chloroflexota bacterium]|nr:RNA polymerase subunit sigma-70 [Chloroflexota bacterium]
MQAGDADAFAAVTEPYRPQLRVHCYRMLGSFDDAEDMVQETMLRAWRARSRFEGRSLLRTWLYRIATNACLNSLERSPRRVMPQDVVPAITTETDTSQASDTPPWRPELPWLQPYPDDLLGQLAAPTEAEPDAMAISRETVELTFLAALQHLPPRQRAVLLLSDVLDWSAKEVADILELTVPAVNSALQRARSTMRSQLPAGRQEWLAARPRSADEQSVLKTFMDAWERADAAMLTNLLREDARWAMPPAALWFDGRAAIATMFELYPIDWHGRDFRMVPTAANRQPAAAAYVRAAGESDYRLVSLHVLRIEEGKIAEVTAFAPELCGPFRLPETLPSS